MVAGRVAGARRRAHARGVLANVDLPAAELGRWAPLDAEARRLLESLVRAGALTGRGVQRIRRVARTVADLAGDDGPLTAEHVAGGLAFRVTLGADEIDLAS